MRQKNGLKRKLIATCLACAISFPLSSLGDMEVIASEMPGCSLTELKPTLMAYNYEEQAKIIYERAKEHLNGAEPYIETGIKINQDQLEEFGFYMQLYFLGETPGISYFYEYNHPETGRILIKMEGLQTCIEQHDIAMGKLKEIVNQTQLMTTPEEKIAYYAKYLYNSYTYDYMFNNKTSYALLTNKSGVCHAYTTTFSWLCKLSEIPTMYVSGTLDGQPHAWNKVKNAEGKWMPIDVTNLFLSMNYTYVEPENYSSHFVEDEHYMF